ncbi:MAG: SOS response-associated peptidase [Oligoflexia bacterium]|nr:SOS response-associated peptidase [Oligoflexia bacterium]
MCGRAYETYTDEELAFRYLGRNPLNLPKRAPNYNFAPTQLSPVVRVVDGERRVELMHWQLIPAWEPEFKTRLSTINARSESVFESRLYKDLVLRQRCIVPLSGFFEWKREPDGKHPYAIRLKDEPIMSVAGIWNAWHKGSSSERLSFSILTTEANSFMSSIHDRMPLILSRENEEGWLDPELREPRAIRELLRPCPEDWLEACEISTRVNAPRNNDPEILKAVR